MFPKHGNTPRQHRSDASSPSPPNCQAITKLEKWDLERTVTYMLTIRMFLAKILNAFIQALSYMLLADPYLFASER